MDRAAITRAVQRNGVTRLIRHFLRGHQPVFLDYPVRPAPRYGHGRPAHPELLQLLEGGRARYRNLLERMAGLGDAMARIPVRPEAGSMEPAWVNGFLPGLDAAALYGMLALQPPETYLEVGSGNSTRFARRAIRDQGLRTRIVSIDPHPRVEIDSIADRVIRAPLEATDLDPILALKPGDILFLDGSHRTFMNSDVTVAFLEVLPRLARGVRVQIHDICLPYDYPPSTRDFYYSEQYVLAAYLLGGARGASITLPNAFVGADVELSRILDPLWSRPGLEAVERRGSSFWMEM
ncbi:MAG TPA: class I SAM-dependent methyltransferase [Candidatus Eisenbacteria bacterium]|nr:class I SAM-dependent methyltransferase [Candidatus Eisenbacteria bacterium]